MGIVKIMWMLVLLILLVVLHGGTILTTHLTNLGVHFLRETSTVTGWIATPTMWLESVVRGIDHIIRKLSFGKLHLHFIEREFKLLELFLETFAMLADFDAKCKGARTLDATLIFVVRHVLSPHFCTTAQLLMLSPATGWVGTMISQVTFDPRGTNNACTSGTDITCTLVWGLPLVFFAFQTITAIALFAMLFSWELKMLTKLTERFLGWVQNRMLALDFTKLPEFPETADLDGIPLVSVETPPAARPPPSAEKTKQKSTRPMSVL